MESVLLTTSDGVELHGDLAVAEHGAEHRPAPGAVVCHPHPQYGGDRYNTVVDAVFRHLPTVGCSALRFDFRADFGGGVTERLDVVAALDQLSERVDGALYLVGYSFGAAVALSTADTRPTGIVAIAPPLAMMQVPPPTRPTLVLTPQHDQFTPPDAARPIVEDWPDTDFAVVESTDHFLLGRTQQVAEIAGSWILERG